MDEALKQKLVEKFEEAKRGEAEAQEEYIAAKAVMRGAGAKLEAARSAREKIEAAAEVMGIDLKKLEAARTAQEKIEAAIEVMDQMTERLADDRKETTDVDAK